MTQPSPVSDIYFPGWQRKSVSPSIDSHKSLLFFDKTIVQKEFLVITQLFFGGFYQNNFTFFHIKAVMTSSKALGGILKTMVAVYSE